MLERTRDRSGGIITWALFLVFLGTPWLEADPALITRIYLLKNRAPAVVIQVINFSIVNPTGKRIMSCRGKELVVTDTVDQQDEIAQLLPIIDQPGKETQPLRMQMEMTARAANYLQQKKKIIAMAEKANPAPTASSTNNSGPARSYDIRQSTQAYKSVYSDEDVRLMKKPRVIQDDPVLPSISGLALRGIFRATSGSPLAILSYESANFTARDGGLFENNHSRVKGIVTKVLKDRVIITGPDHIAREIKFSSTL